MTPDERQYAAAYLERTKSVLLEATANLTESQWFFKPTPADWSPAECVEHLAITEGFIVGTIRKLADNAPDAPDVLASCAGKEALIEKRVPRRGFKAQAPEQARPRGQFATHGEVIQCFLATRDASIDYARTTAHPIREHTFPHFVFGPLDGYQWLIFCAAHTERHLAQLLEAIEAEGRSKL
ncbi:MAG: DinB family protein [Acidobacteriia bacterium]|nr:DinB family protein [Terriglobia bacterium]